MTIQRCMLPHDILNNLAAIIGNCDELDIRFPSPWCFERTTKIKGLAQEISNMLRSSECEMSSCAPQA